MNRQYVFLFGLLLGVCSLAFGQEQPAANPLPAEQKTEVAVPVDGEQPAEVDPLPVKPKELAVIYNGEETLSPQIIMGDWGVIQHAPNTTPFQPTRLGRKTFGLTLTTFGRYQGTRFDFVQPLAASQLLGAKNVYLELYLRAMPGDAKATAATAPPMMAPGNPMVPGNPTMPPGSSALPFGMPPGAAAYLQQNNSPLLAQTQPQYGEGMPLDLTATPTSTVPLPTLTNLRFTFFTDKGTTVVTAPTEQFFPKDTINRMWVRIGIPLSTISAQLPVGGSLTRLVVSSDQPTAFYLGRLAFVLDEEPLKMTSFILPQFLEAGSRIFFAARVKSGLARYETTWVFDKDAGDTVDAQGDRALHTYDKEGVYNVKCTIRDLSGGKETLQQDIRVKVSGASGE